MGAGVFLGSLFKHSPLFQVGVVVSVPLVHDRSGGDPRFLEQMHHLVMVLLAGPLADMLVQLIMVPVPALVVCKLLVPAPDRAAQHPAESLPVVIVAQGDGDPAVFPAAGIAALYEMGMPVAHGG